MAESFPIPVSVVAALVLFIGFARLLTQNRSLKALNAIGVR